MKRVLLPLLAVMLAALVLVLAGPTLGLRPGAPAAPLRIVAGSENQALQPLIEDWSRRERVPVEITWMGSVDIARELEKGRGSAFDAVWPAQSLWIELGDRHKVVSTRDSIIRSPVVLGIRRSIAERLGWIGRQDVTIQQIEAAARSGAFRLAMTSATQSNSGAAAYFGLLYALAGNPDTLSVAMLDDGGLQDRLRGFLSLVDRSAGSSGWLKDALVENPGRFDAMFNYESMVIEANRTLTERGQEPLYAVYPSNGPTVADSPIGLIDRGDARVTDSYQSLRAFLLSPETQAQLVGMGRRTGLIGSASDIRPDPRVWNPDWGVDPGRQIAPLPTPAPEVIEKALSLYQTQLRKPSLTVWLLDTSGSMQGQPIEDLRRAMTMVLDPRESALNLLQPSSRDVTVVIPFDGAPEQPTVVQGGTPEAVAPALQRVRQMQAGGGTDLYAAIAEAAGLLARYRQDGTLGNYLPAIIAMTDGRSDTANHDAAMQAMRQGGLIEAVPIHAIAFGDADVAQLTALTRDSAGRLFPAGGDIAAALRAAKGYN